ncbi:MAG: hypothetical protein P8P35_13760 [Planktotalea sp.]|jgi:hypothetical protein|uniref:hypothetical protein n=1 Tax=Planktotalea sp. TaxID=2029877 RepID=UPI0001839F9B|nr:hypothetical protein [Planktotalea sp.]EDZ40757.1 hypothetical protein RB2083_271 [Rhodobacteraceae bacterium HTCC2083]MDG1085152.1 hypothetical protein [Planktotalea sp.]
MNDFRADLSEIVTVFISPFHSARGPIVKVGPAPDEATICVGTSLVHGKCLTLIKGMSL